MYITFKYYKIYNFNFQIFNDYEIYRFSSPNLNLCDINDVPLLISIFTIEKKTI